MILSFLTVFTLYSALCLFLCAFVLVQSKTTRGTGGSRHTFGGDQVPAATLLCRGAKVGLEVRNLMPDWGLHRNAFGTVVEIVFEKDKDPNAGDLPRFVVVDFPEHIGPKWHPDHPTWAPLPCLKVRCEEASCCEREVAPLKLAYACTIHTFQGQNVGPTKAGQPDNRFLSVVVDPGTSGFEGQCPGLFYTVLTRATTIGKEGDRMNSALFFQGNNMKPARVKNLTTSVKGELCKKVQQRTKRTKRLKRNTIKSSLSENEKSEILEWADSYRCTKKRLQKVLACWKRRSPRDDCNF